MLAVFVPTPYSAGMTGNLTLEIPRDALESARMTVEEAKLELAIALFSSARLSLGKASELAGLAVGDFQLHLGARQIGPHYDANDARDDARMLAALRNA